LKQTLKAGEVRMGSLLETLRQDNRYFHALFSGKRNDNRVDFVPSICHNDLNYLKEYIDKRGSENND
jgi:hypothetical protein